MSEVNIVQQNFAAGELSAKMRARYDLPVFYNGLERMVNFIADTEGNARFRNGSYFVIPTRRNAVGVLIPFQFNDAQSYDLVFTNGYMRVLKDNGIVVESSKTITGATAANPVVITSASHGYSNGDEVLISGIVGMTRLNGRSFIVTNVTANTFELYDNDGVAINGSGYSAYVSGGIAEKIYEITTPYLEADLFTLKYAQNADTMYIDHPNYDLRKLTRTGDTAWSLARYSRTADPFLDKKVIGGITQANPGVVTTTGAHGYATGDEIIIEEVVGMTQVNSKAYKITVLSGTTFSLQTLAGVNVDTSGYTAWSSVGFASNRKLLPSAVSFYEGRIVHGASDSKPETFWGSRTPTTAGVARYDDFTTGTDPDHAFVFTLSPSNGKVDKIEWFAGTDRFLAIGTFGGISKADGGNADDSITPSNINVRPVDSEGVADTPPVRLGSSLIYLQRNLKTIFSFEFEVLADGYVSTDRNLVSDHITESGIKQLAFVAGRPDILWSNRIDGVLLGVTYKSREDVTGWHRHYLGGTNAKVLSVSPMPRAADYDQLWMIVERTINGATRRYIEFMTDEVIIPERDDYFTDTDSEDDDDAVWRRVMFERQKQYIHVDSALTYDGTNPGIDAGASVTPAAVSGDGVVFTASAAVFKSTDVGRQIWAKMADGTTYGRAEIVGYTDTTHVTCDILVDFASTSAMAAGDWYLTTASITALDHLEGQVVAIIADGGDHPTKTVASGAITLDYQASVVHVGLQYYGLLKSMDLEAGGTRGPAKTKPKNINRIGLYFLNTLGAKYGTNLYRMKDVTFRSSADNTDRPPPLFSGAKTLVYEDVTSSEKHVYIQQRKPLPCRVLAIVPFLEVDNE